MSNLLRLMYLFIPLYPSVFEALLVLPILQHLLTPSLLHMSSELPLEQLCTHLWLLFEELLLFDAQQAFHLQLRLDEFFDQTVELDRLLD